MKSLSHRLVGLAVIVVVGSLGTACTSAGDSAVGDGGPAPEAASSPTATSTVQSGPFPGFWPERSYADATAAQARADRGEDPWRLDTKQVTTRFLADFANWDERFDFDGQVFEGGVDVEEPQISGSSADGWTAVVPFRRYRVYEGKKSPMGERDALHMMGLRGVEKPGWFVTSLKAKLEQVTKPADGESVGSTINVAGRGMGYEATIHLEVKDDAGRSLGKAFANGGSSEPAPFSGKITFGGAQSPSGVLIVTPDKGVEGPDMIMSVVRIHFGSAPAATAAPGTSLPSGSGSRVTVYYVTQRSGRFQLARESHFVEATPRLATAALEELVHGVPFDSQNTSPYPKASQILSVTISNGVATVDWSANVLTANVSGEYEAIGIQAAVWTLTEFSSINKVRFTVEGRDRGTASNGRTIEDWWGHVGLHGQPFTRDSSISVVK